MDALHIVFSKSLLGRLYLLLIYTVAAYVVVLQLADTITLWLFLLLIALLFYREWRQRFSASSLHVKGIRYQQKAWSLLLADEWQSMDELKYYYQVPWLIAVRAIDESLAQPRIIIVWRDSVSAQEWRLLRIYLAL